MSNKPSLSVSIIPVTPFQQNCSLLICTETSRAALVDPGGDLDVLEQALQHNKVTLEKIFITHGHIDHAGGAAELAERLNVPIEGPHEDDSFWIDQMDKQGSRFGFEGARAFTPARWLKDGDTIAFGNQSFDVYHCPGHTPGHVIFHQPEIQLAIVGDVLFQGSIGRTDFPRGNHEDLINAIRQKLWPLGSDVTFIPGHGPTSTFGQERSNNPFVADHLF